MTSLPLSAPLLMYIYQYYLCCSCPRNRGVQWEHGSKSRKENLVEMEDSPWPAGLRLDIGGPPRVNPLLGVEWPMHSLMAVAPEEKEAVSFRSGPGAAGTSTINAKRSSSCRHLGPE
jgi:hypothetical protein